MNKLSVIVITKNEEKNIRRCLESVQWADEIIVVDTFSNDKTVAICREFTDKVFQKNWTGYGPQKNFCASKAKNRPSQSSLYIDFREKILLLVDGFAMRAGTQI